MQVSDQYNISSWCVAVSVKLGLGELLLHTVIVTFLCKGK